MIDKLHSFASDISHVEQPEKLTFPFYYEPHPIALQAVEELQEYLLTQTDFNHNFGIGDDDATVNSLGKMFGVLVVSDADGKLGYLSAFSGKLGDQNIHVHFVPSVFDMLDEGSYFVMESAKLDVINKEILKLEVETELYDRKLKLEEKRLFTKQTIEQQKIELKVNQKKRQALRTKAEYELSKDACAELKTLHNQESINDNFLLREYTVYLNGKLQLVQDSYEELALPIVERKGKMKSISFALQSWLFEQYNFLNINQEPKNVIDIFEHKIPNVPPSGAGDCAAPKLFQYAFLNRLKPIALAEFWWGKPNANSRKHKYFYPACRGKCEPILGHMLAGIDMDPNPLLVNPAIGKELETVYEDDHLLVINKPAEFMSVPGKSVTDSVQERLKSKYPNSTGPMIVHRLDMSTSGLMIVTKSKEVHKVLQEQFKTRKVKKRYVALLDGLVPEDEGYINLPLRVDLNNRPYQIVCEEHGKSARTKYEVISRSEGKTRIHFYPITGRTHQLRVHASHHLGLNTPIIGDDLYGRRGERLCLHAEAIWFVHPVSGEDVFFEVGIGF